LGKWVPIYKSGPKDDPTNYRGITIGSALGKLFAKIFNTRLENLFWVYFSILKSLRNKHMITCSFIFTETNLFWSNNIQIIEVLQLVVHWENYLPKYLIQD
jgi:hypothetical protein